MCKTTMIQRKVTSLKDNRFKDITRAVMLKTLMKSPTRASSGLIMRMTNGPSQGKTLPLVANTLRPKALSACATGLLSQSKTSSLQSALSYKSRTEMFARVSTRDRSQASLLILTTILPRADSAMGSHLIIRLCSVLMHTLLQQCLSLKELIRGSKCRQLEKQASS